MKFWTVCILIFLVLGSAWAEEEIEGFVVTPQSAEFALYQDVLAPESVGINLACVGTKVQFEEERAGTTFTYECDFVCSDTGFEWQVVSGRPWVKFSPERGYGTSVAQIQVSVDKDYLKNIVPETCGDQLCFKSAVTFRITYHLSHCVVSYEECDADDNCRIRTDPAYVTYYKEQSFEDFVTVYYSLAGLAPQISPKELFFQTTLSEDGQTTFDWQKVKVLAGHQGWDYETNAPWLEFEKERDSADLPQSYLYVRPKGLTAPGLYQAYVKIKDRATGEASKLLVTTRVEGSNPALANLVYALSSQTPLFDRQEIFTPQWFSAAFYLGQEGLEGPLYVEVEHSAFPDYVFAYRWEEGQPRFDVAFYQGSPVPEIDKLYYASQGASLVKIGTFRLVNLPGEAHIRLKQGYSWELSRILAEIDLSLQGIAGSWQVVDTFESQQYVHPSLLIIKEDLSGLSATWGDYKPLIRYSTDPSALYEIVFQHGDFTFRYLIDHVEAGYFSGWWSYTVDGFNYSVPQPFYGTKTDLREGETP